MENDQNKSIITREPIVTEPDRKPILTQLKSFGAQIKTVAQQGVTTTQNAAQKMRQFIDGLFPKKINKNEPETVASFIKANNPAKAETPDQIEEMAKNYDDFKVKEEKKLNAKAENLKDLRGLRNQAALITTIFVGCAVAVPVITTGWGLALIPLAGAVLSGYEGVGYIFGAAKAKKSYNDAIKDYKLLEEKIKVVTNRKEELLKDEMTPENFDKMMKGLETEFGAKATKAPKPKAEAPAPAQTSKPKGPRQGG